MLSKASARRLIAVSLTLGVLAGATPAASLASNGGGGPRPVGQSR